MFGLKTWQVTADEARGFVRDIGADKVEFTFKKPKSIEIGGSYAIQCIVKPEVNVDLFVRMPKVSKYYNVIVICWFDNKKKCVSSYCY